VITNTKRTHHYGFNNLDLNIKILGIDMVGKMKDPSHNFCDERNEELIYMGDIFGIYCMVVHK
jgi:hypothetical protein